MITPYVLFFVAGLGFGYAASGKWKWLPLAFPLALFLGAVLNQGIEAEVVLRLVIALLLTAAGVLLGVMLQRRADSREQAGYA
jgi:hypothetical protein